MTSQMQPQQHFRDDSSLRHISRRTSRVIHEEGNSPRYDATPEKPKYEVISWSTRSLVTENRRLSVVGVEKPSSPKNTEERQDEEGLPEKYEIKGTRKETDLDNPSKTTKTTKIEEPHPSKSHKKELTFSISPKKTSFDGPPEKPVREAAEKGAKVHSITYSTKHTADVRSVVHPSSANLAVLEPSSDPYSASIQHTIEGPDLSFPYIAGYVRRASEDNPILEDSPHKKENKSSAADHLSGRKDHPSHKLQDPQCRGVSQSSCHVPSLSAVCCGPRRSDRFFVDSHHHLPSETKQLNITNVNTITSPLSYAPFYPATDVCQLNHLQRQGPNILTGRQDDNQPTAQKAKKTGNANREEFYVVLPTESGPRKVYHASRLLLANRAPEEQNIAVRNENDALIEKTTDAQRTAYESKKGSEKDSCRLPTHTAKLQHMYGRCSPAGSFSPDTSSEDEWLAEPNSHASRGMLPAMFSKYVGHSCTSVNEEPGNNPVHMPSYKNAFHGQTSPDDHNDTSGQVSLSQPCKMLAELKSLANPFLDMDPYTAVALQLTKRPLEASLEPLQLLAVHRQDGYDKSFLTPSLFEIDSDAIFSRVSCSRDFSTKPCQVSSTSLVPAYAYKVEAPEMASELKPHRDTSTEYGLNPEGGHIGGSPACATKRLSIGSGSLRNQLAKDGSWRPKPLPRSITLTRKKTQVSTMRPSGECISLLQKFFSAELAKKELEINKESKRPIASERYTTLKRFKSGISSARLVLDAPIDKPENDHGFESMRNTEGTQKVEPILSGDCFMQQVYQYNSASGVSKIISEVSASTEAISAQKSDSYRKAGAISTIKSDSYRKAREDNSLYRFKSRDKEDAPKEGTDSMLFEQNLSRPHSELNEPKRVAITCTEELPKYTSLPTKMQSPFQTIERIGGWLSEARAFPIDLKMPKIRRTPLLLYPEIPVSLAISLLCVAWIAAVYPLRPRDSTEAVHIVARNTTIMSPITVVLETFRYWTESKTTVVSASEPQSRAYFCSSIVCMKEAMYLLSALNKDVSPCDNFYRYACRAWEGSVPLPARGLGVSFSKDTMLEESEAFLLRGYIMSKSTASSTARFLYKACMASYHHTATFIKTKVLQALPMKTWPYNGSAGPLEIWKTAGIVARKYGLAALLKVGIGFEALRNEATVDLELPRPLLFSGDDSRPKIMQMLRDAIREVATEFGHRASVANLSAQIVAVFKGLAKFSHSPVPTACQVRKLKHVEYIIRAFVEAVFEQDVNGNTTVVVKKPHLVMGALVRLTHDMSARSFLNYLGFRLAVSMGILFPDSFVNVRRLFSIEFAGRVVADDMKWFLCMRFAERVAPGCLERAQTDMFAGNKAAGLARRMWLQQMEEYFSRNLRHMAWISEKTRRLVETIINSYRFLHLFAPSTGSNEAQCLELPRALISRRRLKESQAMLIILAIWEICQKKYLRQIIRNISPRNSGFLFETNPRLIEAQRTVYVPSGLVNSSVPENSTMLAFHLSRVATRLFRALVPLTSSEGGHCSGGAALTLQSLRSLARLRKCLKKDALSLPQQLQSGASDVLLDDDGPEAQRTGLAILAQTAALGLAFAAFKEMINVGRIWRLDFRLASLPNVSAEQLFFLYYALDNCERSDAAYRAHVFDTQLHLPAEQRVNLPLRHLTPFADAFGCTPGLSAMAPRNHCSVLRWPASRAERASR